MAVGGSRSRKIIEPDVDVTEMEPRKPVMGRFGPVVVVVLMAMSFGLGSLWTEVKLLREGTATPTTTVTDTTTTGQAAAQPQAGVASAVTLDTIKGLFSKDVVKFGDANRKVLFVEVADPSCPYCHAAAGKNPEVSKQMGPNFTLVADGGTYVSPVQEMHKLVDAGKASYIYIYMPGHGNGEMAMKALYCANEKGKFWAAHDLLMNNSGYALENTDVKNDKTKSAQVADFLKTVMDVTEMKSCLDSGKYDARLQADTALATSLGVNGTPGFFVNAQSFPGAYSYTDLKTVVETALK